jgi:hypothetical protein
MSFHKNQTGASLHVLHAFTYADAAARIGAIGLVSADVGKIAKQSDNNRYYILTNHSPVTWSEITAAGGGGGINYISNTTSEDDASGWSAYADAAGTRPVNGTGGSPTLTIVKSTSNPLRETASFLVTKDAANRQGEGVSTDFTIDRADMSHMLDIEFDYEASGSFVAGSPSVESDIGVYIYDVTNSALIQPSVYKLEYASGFKGKYKCAFQASANSQSYRLILHVATTNASAWTLKFDNVRVGPIDSTSLLENTKSISAKFQKSSSQSISDSTWTIVDFNDKVFDDNNAVTTGGSWKFTAPVAGKYQINANVRFSPSASGNRVLGIFKNGVGDILDIENSPSGTGDCFIQGSTLLDLDAGDYIDVRVSQNSGGSLSIGVNADQNLVSIFKISEMGTTPSDNGVVAAKYHNDSASQSISSGVKTIVDFDLKDFDTNNAVTTGGSWKFTAPVAGKYSIDTAVHFAANATGTRELHVHVNGSWITYLANMEAPAAGGAIVNGSILLDLQAGDYFDIRATQNSGSPINIGAANTTYCNVHLVNARSALPQSDEKVSIRYTHAPGDTITTSNTILDYETKTYDTHNAVTTGGSWKFTAPVAGRYKVSARYAVQSANIYEYYMSLWHNRNVYSASAVTRFAAVSGFVINSLEDVVTMNAGDYLEIKKAVNTGSDSVYPNVGYNWIIIDRIN